MKVRPGSNLVWTAATVAVASLLGLLMPVAALVVVLAAVAVALALIVCDFRALRRQLAGVTVARRLPNVIGRDLPFTVEWSVSGLATRGELRDVVPGFAQPRFVLHRLVAQAAPQTVHQEFRIDCRGLHSFGPVWMRLVGPFGMLEGQASIEHAGKIRVLPEQFASRDELRKDSGAEMVLLDKVTFSRQFGVGTEFESLAEYRYGDDPRRIDWRTTARYRRPIIRRYQIERHRDVMIVIDCGRLMGTQTQRGSKLDCAIDAALLLGRVALQSGDRCGLGLFDDRVRGYLPPISGAASMNALADCIYDAQVAWRESDFTPMFATLQQKQVKRSLLVVISDVVDSESSELFRASLLRLQKRHIVLFAALKTPVLRDIIDEPVNTMLDVARKAVTFRLLREREHALHSLGRGGVFVLDVEPSELTVPLINSFVELRQRNLL